MVSAERTSGTVGFNIVFEIVASESQTTYEIFHVTNNPKQYIQENYPLKLGVL